MTQTFSRRTQTSLLITAVMCLALLLFLRNSKPSPNMQAALPAQSYYTNFTQQSLVDQTGEAFDVSSLLGKITLFNFVFTQCSNTCPLQTAQLKQLYDSLSADVKESTHFVSVSIDPGRDTSQLLRDFSRRFNIDPEYWSFVTGDYQDVSHIADDLDLYGGRDSSDPLNHVTTLWLVDPAGTLVMRYLGDPMDSVRLKTDLTQLYDLHFSLVVPQD